MKGFMVSIMNPVTWHVVRRTILPGDQRWSSPDKRVPHHYPFMIGTMNPPRRCFVHTAIHDDAEPLLPPLGD
jgi:hypothetical protein